MTVKQKTYRDIDIVIERVSLPSKEEIEVVPMRLRRYRRWYWLASPGKYDYYASCINTDGSVYETGSSVMYTCGALRPALFADFASAGLREGDIIVVNEKEFEIVSEKMAFITTDIGAGDFRYDGDFKNDYEISGAKRQVDAWFKGE